MKLLRIFAALLLLTGSARAVTQVQLPILDGASASHQFTFFQDLSGNDFQGTGLVDATGAAITTANPLPVIGGTIQSGASIPISITSNTTTQLIAVSGSTAIYITSWDVTSLGSGNITFEYGTGGSCGTGTHALTGAYAINAASGNAGISKGTGLGPILFVPASNALCAVTTAVSGTLAGSLSYNQQ